MRSWQWRIAPARTPLADAVPARRERVGEGHLLLVNADHPVRRPARGLADVPDDLLRPRLTEEPRLRLERTCLSLLNALLGAACGKESIALVSGYRSHELQERIYADSVREHGAAFTASYVALPGASEHQTGLAVDVGLFREDVDYIRPDFPNDGACALFKKLASDYGFIQRYREEKTGMTGIAAEPWHYRYVGYPHAAFMERESLCLEEYTDLVARRTGQGECLRIETDAADFEIYYVAASAGVTPVPVPAAASGAGWQLSGNNRDGFVVTVTTTGRRDG